MGNRHSDGFYRDEPLKDYKCNYGWAPYFRYGANTVTGWRRSQEDRICCHLNIFQDLSIFSVFDGHGGGEVSEYLTQNYHNHLIDALKENDVETALYISFLSCDLSIKSITNEELDIIKDGIDTKFKIQDPSTLSKQPEFQSAVMSQLERFLLSRRFNRGESSKSLSAGEVPKSLVSPLSKSLIASSKTMQKLFVEPIKDDDDDEEDDDYDIYKEELDSDLSSSLAGTEESDGDDELDSDSSDAVSMTSITLQGSDPEVTDDSKVPMQDSKNDMDDTNQLVKENSEDCSTSKVNMCVDEDTYPPKNQSDNITEEKTTCKSLLEEECSTSNTEDVCANDTAPLVGYSCGSTATVVVLSKEKVYVANVGDSRCVASLKGKAVDLSRDHIPTDPEELLRISRSGHIVKDGRIDDGLNVSRAFGDFALKNSIAQDPEDPVICHPHISVLDINQDLEFIILASDGIWHELSSQDVIDFIRDRKHDDAVDTCTELFELLMPSEVTDDGSGCDNMSAIIIFFEDSKIISYITKSERIRYSYGRSNPKEEIKTEGGTFAVGSKNEDNDDLQIVDVIPMKSSVIVDANKTVYSNNTVYANKTKSVVNASAFKNNNVAENKTKSVVEFSSRNKSSDKELIIEIDLVSSSDESCSKEGESTNEGEPIKEGESTNEGEPTKEAEISPRLDHANASNCDSYLLPTLEKENLESKDSEDPE